METNISEIAEGIFRLSTHVREIAPPAGLTFNQFLIKADEPLLFHCGMRGIFPSVSAALSRVMPIEKLRWIGFGHVEADECGAMNQWLAKAPQASVMQGQVACMVSLNDLADRPPRALSDGETLDLGGKKIRFLSTPHVPHGWDAGVIFEESTRTLLCGDLFTHLGNDAAVTHTEILGPSIAAEEAFKYTSIGMATTPTIRKLAELNPKMLALMHGAAFEGDCAGQLHGLADYFSGQLLKAAA